MERPDAMNPAQTCIEALTVEGLRATVQLLRVISACPKLERQDADRVIKAIKAVECFADSWPECISVEVSAESNNLLANFVLNPRTLEIKIDSGDGYPFLFDFICHRSGGIKSNDFLDSYIGFVAEIGSNYFENVTVNWWPMTGEWAPGYSLADKYEPELSKLYQTRGCLSRDRKTPALHLACTNATSCWQMGTGRIPPERPDKSAISRPWVGPLYDKLKLLVLGINMNECAGYDALFSLMYLAKCDIRDGAIRTFKSKSRDIDGVVRRYSGTLVYHRMACYAAAFLSEAGLMSVDWEGGKIPTGVQLANAFDYMSFTNHIKCSPTGKRSEPTEEMWGACGKHVLKEELQILRPSHLLVLGTSANAYSLGRHIFEERVKWGRVFGERSRAIVRIGRYDDESLNLNIYVVPHPHARNSKFMDVLGNLRQALDKSPERIDM